MPAAFCNDTQPYAFTVNGECDFFIDWTHDGVSVPPNCNGSVDSIRWANRSNRTYYAHLPATRNGPFTQSIPPGANGSETRRGVLNAAGLQALSDVRQVEINTSP